LALLSARRHGKKAHEFFLDLFTKNTAQAQRALYRKSPKGKPRPPPPGSPKKPP
jgi:hypothetical protein